MSITKILIVEDESVIAMELESRLSSMNYNVLGTASNAKTALSKVELGKPDLILMDINIHGPKDGIETAEEIRSRFNIPIVYLTAYADDETLNRAKNTQPFGYLVKPFQERELRATIEMAVYKDGMEKQVREKQNFIERITQTMPDIVYVLDAVDQHAVILNSESFISFGYSKEQFADREHELQAFIHPDDQISFSRIQESLSEMSDEDIFALEYRLKDSKGNWRIMSARHRVLKRDSDGKVIQILGIAQDVTLQKQAEAQFINLNIELEQRVKERTAELNESNANLESANRELEAFAYSVSHDLRAPIRAVDGFTRILQEEYEKSFDHEGKRIISIVRKEATRMGTLVDDLLAFSRLGRTEMSTTTINMRNLVHTVYNAIVNSEQSARIEFRITDPFPSVDADAVLIRQVWTNLIENAVKFSSGAEMAKIRIGAKSLPGEVEYFISDNGVGFDMEYKDKLFGVFQRLHSEKEFPGTGVGLAIVHRIVTRHGGQVWAESQLGEGAVFHFTLPLSGRSGA